MSINIGSWQRVVGSAKLQISIDIFKIRKEIENCINWERELMSYITIFPPNKESANET